LTADKKFEKPHSSIMKNHFVKIISIEHITHDTVRIVTEKPKNYTFEPGQATDIAINKTGWLDKRRPFTFTSLPEDKHIEFIIKTYPSHDGATDKLLEMHPGDELILHDIFGSIRYKGEGIFIAGGAGVTPFLAMLRNLRLKNISHNNSMIFANKTKADIILGEELEDLLTGRITHILSEEETNDLPHGFITKEFLTPYITDVQPQYFYICGPLPMMKAVEEQLTALGVPAKRIVKEAW
jgi:ferredoxin-NADP reductase